jgi:hypothetical protein
MKEHSAVEDPKLEGHAPAPETVDRAKESERLTMADRKLQDGQSSKETVAPEKREKEEDYDSMTVAELKELAHKRGVQVSSDWRKDEIIEALEKS